MNRSRALRWLVVAWTLLMGLGGLATVVAAQPPDVAVGRAAPQHPFRLVVVGESVEGQERASRPAPFPFLPPDDADFQGESEPNNTQAQANTLTLPGGAILATVSPVNDVDYFSFQAQAGDRIFAATMTAFSNTSTDSLLEVLGSSGAVLEADDNDGVFGALAAVIGGTPLPTSGTYFLRVSRAGGQQAITPYHLHFRLTGSTPPGEIEPNNIPTQAQPLPAGGVRGTVPVLDDVDIFALTLNAGDTVYLGLDMDPERDGTTWNGFVGLGLFEGETFMVANDGNIQSPNAEAFFQTVQEGGTYYAIVGTFSTTGVGASATYQLAANVVPARARSCPVLASAAVPRPLGPAVGSVTVSTLTVPISGSLSDLNVMLQLTHTAMPDLDVVLRSPTNVTTALFLDVGDTDIDRMDLVLDDEAARPVTFNANVADTVFQPEDPALAIFDGSNPTGTWQLILTDDGNAGEGGILQGWSLDLCGSFAPPAAPTLVVQPSEIATTHGPSVTVTTEPLTIANLGTAPLTWTVVEEAGGGGSGPCVPGDLPWATVAPTAGTTAPQASSSATVTLASAALPPGDYTGTLCVASNDPQRPQVRVPLRLRVERSATAVQVGSVGVAGTENRLMSLRIGGSILFFTGVALFARRQRFLARTSRFRRLRGRR